jgi:hypothetical protein
MTREEQHIAKMLSKRSWRIDNLYWIENERGEKVKFKRNLVQRLFWKSMWWLNVILKSRQHGISTLVNIMQLDECLFNPHRTCGIVDKTDLDATKKLSKMKFAYDHLDDPEDPSTSPLGAAVKEAIKLTRANDHELEFSNKSKVWAGTSLRGGTVQFLHISELGPIAFNNPKKAEEIRAGALNTVHAGCKVVIESTHEGGKFGLNYEMIVTSQGSDLDNLTEMDWKFHFFAWWQDPKNRLKVPASGLILPREDADYFRGLEKEGLSLDAEQKHWYSKKRLTQKHAMMKEHPSTPEEAVNAVVKGAIYGNIISRLRREGRIRNFEHDRNAPLYTFWDLGQSDYTAIWLIQIVGPEFYALRHFAWKGEQPRFYVAKLEEWESELGLISCHYLPHDAKNVSGPGSSWWQHLIDAGLQSNRMKKVPRTPDIWIGINHGRSLLPRFYIHQEGCDQEAWYNNEELIPSGISSLEGYHTKTMEDAGKISEKPVHDETSHSCDSFRTFFEAHMRGMIKDPSIQQTVTVKTGIRHNANATRRRVRVIR